MSKDLQENKKEEMESIPSRNKSYRIKDKIETFWAYCEEHSYIPDIETLCMFLDISRVTLWKWEHSENKLLANIIKNTKTRIFHSQKQLALKGKLNSAIFIFNAINNFNYVQKVEHEHNTNTNINVVFNVPKVQLNLPTKQQDTVVIEATNTATPQIPPSIKEKE